MNTPTNNAFDENTGRKVLQQFGLTFNKVCINSARAFDFRLNNGKPEMIPMSYRRTDLAEWAKEAFDKGETHFYYEPVNPDEPNGTLRQCGPKYIYRLKNVLDEKEYETLVYTLISLSNTNNRE